ncbi:hypothetical protein NDU88_000500 [Pleurodeles waltl]|uniref:Insulin-like growth factor-binding protein 6 n=1 Tax=Pleurodeles waltl TaxID=8319 RepID=A0AAV7S7A7_PLEWA|nr:hypothetical protein NDU88_000500 [Pleurodeles waltl]
MRPRCWLLVMLLLEAKVLGRGDASECLVCGDGELDPVEQQPDTPGAGHPKDPCKNPLCYRAAGTPCRRDCHSLAPEEPCDPACYRDLGEACGVYTPSCARGLRCTARDEERMPLHALLQGNGICRKHTAVKPEVGHRLKQIQPTLESTHLEAKVMNGSENKTHELPTKGDTANTPLPNEKDLFHTRPLKRENPKPDVHHPRQHSELVGPCRLHMEQILRELHLSPFFKIKDVYIPNCDTRGFYRRKQCKSSKGRGRGRCWCVDNMGYELSKATYQMGNFHCLAGAN